MRNHALICLLLFLTACASGYCQQAPTAPAPTVRRVDLELKETPLKMAIERVVEFSSADYKMDPALDKSPYDKVIVSIRFVNVPYYEALGSLLNTHGLAVKLEDEVRVIGPADSGMVAFGAGSVDLVTMHVPRMPISEALIHLYKDSPRPVRWAFEGTLGMTAAKGASFYQFPRESAAHVLLAASGLVPPSGQERVVRTKGAADLSKTINYTPGGCFPLSFGMTKRDNVPPAVAVAAYQPSNSRQQLFVILANQEQDMSVLDKVLSTSGVNYVIRDRNGNRDAKPDSTRLVSIKLYGVTLEQALKHILPDNMRHRLEGPLYARTLIIEPVPTK